MIRLHYADGYLVTADEIAEAVMQYSRALAVKNTSDLVTIPIMEEDGTPAESTLLIGPASQLYTTPIEEPYPELVDREIAVELVDKAEKLRADPAAFPQPLDERETVYDHDEYR